MSTALAAAAGHHGVPGAPAPGAWLVAVLVAAALALPYAAGVAAYRSRMPRPWRPARTAAWCAGALLVGVAVSPALAVVPEPAVRHMLQHVLLGMLAPVGLVLAAPVTLLLGAASTRGRRALAAVLAARVVRVLTHPVTAALLHVGALVVLYLTPLYGLAGREPAVHALVLVHFLLAGTLFAWAVAGTDPAPHRPGLGTRAVVLVVAAGVHGALAKYLYAHADRLPRAAPTRSRRARPPRSGCTTGATSRRCCSRSRCSPAGGAAVHAGVRTAAGGRRWCPGGRPRAH
ncbi:cytochrome c oxidase assembly protein [Cellulomonas sp. JZ18]|uniref:cytochrome c oxidase assembly protein n=1 Tax=Cellulomonas sp. JZ18 TaxID=2654191 RepID=UPI0012D44DFD|nr:cytochrome c oxidase assembly protein [Cellulomonas sp. JZ18]QGQ20656.1 cytochrome c oxidase assembly protein [Cellulomonas sp. JZ18]